VLAAIVNLNKRRPLHPWGFVQISLSTHVIILMVVVFVLAIVLPFLTGRRESNTAEPTSGAARGALSAPTQRRRPPEDVRRSGRERRRPGQAHLDGPVPGPALEASRRKKRSAAGQPRQRGVLIYVFGA